MTVGWQIQPALLAYLRGDAGVKAVLGDPARVYDQPPHGAAWPHVAFGRATVQSIGGVGVELSEVTLSLMCVSRFTDAGEARSVAAAVAAAADGAELALDGARLAGMRVVFVDVFRGADLKTVYGLVRVRAVVEAVEAF